MVKAVSRFVQIGGEHLKFGKRHTSHECRIRALNDEINALQAENKRLRNEVLLLTQNVESYKEMLVRLEDIKNQYQREISEVMALKDVYQDAIDSARLAEKKYSQEFQSLVGKMKHS